MELLDQRRRCGKHRVSVTFPYCCDKTAERNKREEGFVLAHSTDHEGGCLSQSFYSCTNIMTKKQVGEERFYSVYTFHISVHHQRKSGLELKRVRKQELMQRPWRDVSYWLASPGLLSLLSYRTQKCQSKDGPQGTLPLHH